MHQNALSILRIHILRSYLNLVCARKLEIDAPKCSERGNLSKNSRGKGLQWNKGPLISKIKTDAYFFYDSDTNSTRP